MALRALLVFGPILFGICLQAQDTLMSVYGTVRHYVTREPLADVLVSTFDPNDPSYRMVMATNEKGRYRIDLMEERVHRIVFTAEGFYPKGVEIALAGPAPEEWEGGYGMNVEIMLLPMVESLDLWGDGEPIGKARYVPGSGNFEWNIAYTEAYSARFADAMKEYRARLGLKD